MKLLKLTTIFAFVLLFTSCAGMFERRTFLDEMERETDGLWIPGKDFRMTAGDSGRSFRSRQEILKRTPKSYRDSEKSQHHASLQSELEKRLSKLEERDYINFTRYEDHLSSTSEKVYMLTLHPSEWAEYISTRMANEADQHTPTQYTGRAPASIQKNEWVPLDDLQIGMNKNDVVNKWGRPHKVEEAVDIDDRSERWSFYSDGRIKHVFFEKGSVSSWSSD